MKSAELKVFMFIAAVVFGILISLNFSMRNDTEISLIDYQDFYEEKARLYSQIKFLKRQNEELDEKIANYQKIADENEKTDDILKEDFQSNQRLLGTESAKGEGVIIKLEDGELDSGNGFDSFIRKQKTIHDNDINELLNDIKIAGAQGIAINDRRLIYNTSVYCAGQFLVIDRFKTPAPFYIKIIGDSKFIETSLLSEDSTLKKLMGRGIKVDIKIEKNIIIPAYNNKINYDNIKN